MSRLTQKQLGEKIRILREEADTSQEALANFLGITRQAVGQIEKGERKVDSLELMKIAEFFSTSVDFLLNPAARKTKLAKKEMAHKFSFEAKKLEDLILFILEKCGGKPNLGETVLYKLLYFIDFDAFENLGHPITGMAYIKLQFGPVPRKSDYDPVIKKMSEQGKLKIFSHSYFGKTQKRYIALANPNLEIFSAKEIEIIEKVLNRLSDMNATQIANYVHGDVPWKVTADGEVINYPLAYERESPYSHSDYGSLWQMASAKDILSELGPITEEEANYYKNL